MEEKKTLRQEVLSLRDQLSWQDVEAFSAEIARKMFALPEYIAAGTIMYFLNFGKEVMTLKMVPQTFAHAKRVVAPKTLAKERKLILSEVLDVADDLAPGLWDIPEPKAERLRPVAPSEVDFVVVPGVAFDEQGNRLGYGGGYYDRFFANLREGVPLVAVTFEMQILPAVPVAAWDRRVELIITEKRVIDCRSSSAKK